MATSAAAPPPSSLDLSHRRYDVFLSFRGEDTRNNFVSHLFTALHQSGIYTFKDDQQLQLGKSISPELVTAIEESRIAVVVFSKDYASSSWCLDELLKILECGRVTEQKVIPVFYHVNPSTVRQQTGSYSEAFLKHEADKNKMGKVKAWREALTEVSNFTGLDVQHTANGNESECVQQLVNEILSVLERYVSIDGENLVGMRSRIEHVKLLLDIESNKTFVVGIWGMRGIGKTTIAQTLFQEIRYQFDAASFLPQVREDVRKHGTLVHLQQKLLSDIFKGKQFNISNDYEGANLIKIRLRHLKVLLVIDDMDHEDQFTSLVGDLGCLGVGSKIIITTTDKHLLLRHEADKGRIYKVNLLNDRDAMMLFSQNAFNKNQPPREYAHLSIEVVDYTGGLPLALKVLGSFLFGRDVTTWKNALARLKETPKDEIMGKLKISFDGLEDLEKRIFLDIACFFNREKEEHVKIILDSFSFHPEVGIPVLIEKSLIIVTDGRLQMHDLLQEMGRNIIRKEHPGEPGKLSRLWLCEDIHDVLTETKGSRIIEGIRFDMPTQKDVNYSDHAFDMMNKLRYLKVSNAYFSRGVKYLPNELKWLDWHGFPSKSLPRSFEGKKLAGLKMKCSDIIQFPKEMKGLVNLKFINLNRSQKLVRTPDFSQIPNLEILDLEGCTSLTELHQSIAKHKKLIRLNLKGCTNLKSLPNPILMESLSICVLSGCSKLTKFPKFGGNMEKLLELYLDSTAITELPSSIALLVGLRKLILSDCSKIGSLPDNFGNLKCLEELTVDRTAIEHFPPSFELLKKLEKFSMAGCTYHPHSSRFWSQKVRFKYQGSMSLALSSLPLMTLSSLTDLNLSDCNLSEIPSDIHHLSSLRFLNLSGNNFVNLPANISRLSNLWTLYLERCKNLEILQELPSQVGKIFADGCNSLGEVLLPVDGYLWTLCLANCLRLNGSTMAKRSWQFMLQLMVNTWKGSMFFPGKEIPHYCNHQGKGHLIQVKLPLQWTADNTFIGLAICATLDSLPDLYIINPMPEVSFVMIIYVHGTLINNHQRRLIAYIGRDTDIALEHLLVVYLPVHEFLFLDAYSCTHFEAVLEPEDQPVVKTWGVRLLYKGDLQQQEQTQITPWTSRS